MLILLSLFIPLFSTPSIEAAPVIAPPRKSSTPETFSSTSTVQLVMTLLRQQAPRTETLAFLNQISQQKTDYWLWKEALFQDMKRHSKHPREMTKSEYFLTAWHHYVLWRYGDSFFLPFTRHFKGPLSHESNLLQEYLELLKQAKLIHLNLLLLPKEHVLDLLAAPELTRRAAENSAKDFIAWDDRIFELSPPLIDWLLHQEQHSVTVNALIQKATDLYHGDVFAALGVIGGVFFYEMKYIEDPRSPRREQLPLLASKMVPIFTESRDPIGDNFHFWGYLLLSLAGDHQFAKGVSIFYELFYQQDWSDFRMDMVAIDIGTQLRSNFFPMEPELFFP